MTYDLTLLQREKKVRLVMFTLHCFLNPEILYLRIKSREE